MRLKISKDGYQLWLTRDETEDWADKWPCSQIGGKRLFVDVDSNGLCDFAVDGKNTDVDGNELDAIVSDFVEGTEAAKFWPVWA